MKCGECHLLMWDMRCWRNGKRRSMGADCLWTLEQQEAWYERACKRRSPYEAEPMRKHIELRREAGQVR